MRQSARSCHNVEESSQKLVYTPHGFTESITSDMSS